MIPVKLKMYNLIYSFPIVKGESILSPTPGSATFYVIMWKLEA